MLGWLKRFFSPKAQKPVFPQKPPEFPLWRESSFVFSKNGKIIYEERNGKSVQGTAEDKTSAEKVLGDILESHKKMAEDMRKSMDKMFHDI